MNAWTKRITSLVVVAILMLGAFYVGTMVVATNASHTAVVFQAPEQVIVTPPADATEQERALATLYNSVVNSVVSIEVVSHFEHPAVELEDQFAQAGGTGFVLDTNGHIVTNYHVVEGAVQISVNFYDGTIARGEIVGLDPDADIAVIKVDLPAEEFTPLPLADSSQLFVGQTTVALGSPFGRDWTMTTGIISALGRTIRGLNIYSIGEVIQTDTAINPGNSGGPLLNLRGEVIGVNAQIASDVRANSGVGFAIPSNLVSRVAQALIEKGHIDYSYIGIQGGDMTLAQIEVLDLPNNARGIVVGNVENNSPAERGGLQNPEGERTVDGIPAYVRADIITEIDGYPLRDMSDLIAYLASHTQPGQTVTLTVLRNGHDMIQLPVTLSTRPTQ
ncbi:MAG: trypsin-like peptidase domain-containing protein [Anaerolineae bacterium]|nr:trypsin-like peptidase domain-containing protein [Anaerolineae bacterium]